MEENILQICLEPHLSGSDNEKTSTYSSKDENSNYDPIFSGEIKSEYIQFSDHCQVNQIDDGKSHKINDSRGALKAEKTISPFSNHETESTGTKRRQLFTCSHCPKVFSNSSAIAKHKLTHSDERKYACDICGKAFKRQDHLNGHKHTHNANKPHACHLCDRSYSDARSLRRHYENHHQSEFIRCKEQNSGGSSIDESGPVDAFGFLDETKSIKCDVCSKLFKNQSALNGHMRLHGGYGPTKNCITGPGEPRILPPAGVVSSPDKSEVTGQLTANQSSPVTSLRKTNTLIITALPIERTQSQLHSLLTMVPTTASVSKHAMESMPPGQEFEHCLSAISSTVLDSNSLPNISMDELSMCLSPSSLSNHPQHTNSLHLSSCSLIKEFNPSIVTRDITNSTHTSQPSEHTNYSPVTPALPKPNLVSMFNYPTIINDHHHLDEYHPYDWDNNTQSSSSYISTNANVIIDKPWSYYDLPDELDSKTVNPLSALPQISSSTTNNLQDFIINFDSIECSHLDNEWSKFSDGNDITPTSETESVVKKQMACPQPSVALESTGIGSHKKNKSRPAPIFIPPQTSAHMSRLRSPRVWNTTDSKERKIPPYTPPPMLSPQRKGSGLFNSVWYGSNRNTGNLSSNVYPWTTTSSNSVISVISNSYSNNNALVSSTSLGSQQISSVTAYNPTCDKVRPIWLDPSENPFVNIRRNGEPEHFLYQDECEVQTFEDSDGLPTSATPRINIGPHYQADLPAYNYNKQKLREEKRVWDTLLWDPKHFKDTVENTASLDLLMKIASSPAVKSCGLNMEYTFHLLCKFKGDLEKALQALLEDSFVVYDYVYAETTTWTTSEINKFQERLKKHDRDFMRVAYDLQSCGINKSVKACVEFYYVWKQMNNVRDINRFRMKSSRKKLITITKAALHNEETGADNSADVLAASQIESGYNLRKKYPSGHQKAYMSYGSYEYKTSSDSSSREQSPVHCKTVRSTSGLIAERIKKHLPYQCPQCKRKFTKSKAFENHLKSHKA